MFCSVVLIVFDAMCAVIDDEMPALMAIDFMYRCLDIFKQYFGGE